MSWVQDYSVPAFESLLEALTGKDATTLLLEELKRQCDVYATTEPIVVDEGLYGPVMGMKVTLSDGRVYIPKLVECFEENGNHGIDIYEYKLAEETPEVKYVGLDSSDPDIDVYTVPNGYGTTDEAELASDGEIENEGC